MPGINRREIGRPSSRATFKTLCENLDDLSGNSPVFVGMPMELLADGTYEALPRERVIIRLLDGVNGDNDYKILAKLSGLG